MAARGRGHDFELRFQTSRWAEDLVVAAFRGTDWIAVRFGASRFRADDKIPARGSPLKEPDLLVFSRADFRAEEIAFLESADFEAHSAEEVGDGTDLRRWVGRACLALEIEFSPYRAAEMSGRHWKPNKRTRKDPPVAPNIWVKEEDVPRLSAWQGEFGVPIWILHVFDQEAFSIALDTILKLRKALGRKDADPVRLMNETGIFRKNHQYDRTDAQGAAEIKTVYVITPHGSLLAARVEGVEVTAQVRTAKSMKYFAHILPKGGLIRWTEEFLRVIPR